MIYTENRALETLQKDLDIDRAVLLQVSGDQLTITHEVEKTVNPLSDYDEQAWPQIK